jgi:hypothetical protein
MFTFLSDIVCLSGYATKYAGEILQCKTMEGNAKRDSMNFCKFWMGNSTQCILP